MVKSYFNIIWCCWNYCQLIVYSSSIRRLYGEWHWETERAAFFEHRCEGKFYPVDFFCWETHSTKNLPVSISDLVKHLRGNGVNFIKKKNRTGPYPKSKLSIIRAVSLRLWRTRKERRILLYEEGAAMPYYTEVGICHFYKGMIKLKTIMKIKKL